MKFSELNLLDVGNKLQLVGAVYGDGESYLFCLFPDEDMPTSFFNFQFLEMTSIEWQQFIRQSDLLETEVLTRAGKDGPIVKAIIRKSQRQVEQVIQWKCFKRDGYRCRYCGRDDTPLTVDHLVLWEEGGPSTEANMLSACKKCNKARGNMQYAEWLQHPRYLDLSSRLTNEVRRANEAVTATLAAIPRALHVKSR